MEGDSDAILREPPVAGSELDTLLGTLERQRRYVAWKCENLDSSGLRATLGPSTMTLGGLLKPLAGVEHDVFCVKLHGNRPCPPWDTVDWDADRDWEWHSAAEEATATTGLVAYLGAEPVGWVAVEPRTSYPRLLRTRTVWSGRQEDRADDSVWAVTCFVTRRGYRKRGITYALAAAAADFARDHGARALEAYPMITTPDKEITWGELYVGSRQVFADAGFTEVSHPSPRRVVMRIDVAQCAARPRSRVSMTRRA